MRLFISSVRSSHLLFEQKCTGRVGEDSGKGRGGFRLGVLVRVLGRPMEEARRMFPPAAVELGGRPVGSFFWMAPQRRDASDVVSRLFQA